MKTDARRSMDRKNDRNNYSVGDRGSRSVSADRQSRSDLEHFDPRSSYPYNAKEVRIKRFFRSTECSELKIILSISGRLLSRSVTMILCYGLIVLYES